MTYCNAISRLPKHVTVKVIIALLLALNGIACTQQAAHSAPDNNTSDKSEPGQTQSATDQGRKDAENPKKETNSGVPIPTWDRFDIGNSKVIDGVLRMITPESRIQTKESFTGPIEIVVVAKTEKNNIRLNAFNGAAVLFNWEVNPEALRINRPDGNDKRESGSVAMVKVKPLEANTWYTLRWRITGQGMEVAVNDNVVFSERRAYNLSSHRPVFIFSAESVVDVKSFEVTRLQPQLEVFQGVKDSAGLFSPVAVNEANEVIKQIKRDFQKDLIIETYQGLPADRLDQFKKLKTQAAKNEFINKWAKEKSDEISFQGVYVLICNEPKRVLVISDSAMTFSYLEQRDVSKLLIKTFKEKDFNKGLIEAVIMVRGRLVDAHTAVQKPEPNPQPIAKTPSETKANAGPRTAADVFKSELTLASKAPGIGPLEMGMTPAKLPAAFEKLKIPTNLERAPWETEISVYYCDAPRKVVGFPDYVHSILAYFAGQRLYKVIYKVNLVHSDLPPEMLAKHGLGANVSKAQADKIESRVKEDLLAKFRADKTTFEDKLDFQFQPFPNLTEEAFKAFKSLMLANGGVDASLYAARVPGGIKVPMVYKEMRDNDDSYWSNYRDAQSGLFVSLQGQKWDTIGKKGDPSGTISTRWLLLYHVWIPFENNYGYQYASIKNAEIRIMTANPTSTEEWLDRGRAYSVTGNYENAILDFTKAIDLKPTNAAAYDGRGGAYVGKKDYIRAVADLTEAIRLNPKSVYSIVDRGHSYFLMKDYDRSIADFTEAIRLNPRMSDYYHKDRGCAYHGKNDYDRAIADFTESIRLNPKFAAAYYNRSIAHKSKGNQAQADSDLKEALRLDPTVEEYERRRLNGG